jgi:putative addiction module killer protein
MKEIRRSDIFDTWLHNLRDDRAVAHITARIKRLADGSAGDDRFLGKISEMYINYGPGYRIYYRDTGQEIMLLLCGG